MQPSKAQDTTYRVVPLTELFDLTQKNSQQVKVAAAGVGIAQQGVEVAKLQQLPTLSTSVSGGYLGDAVIMDKDFSKSTTVPMPHFSNSFGVQASQLIFKGHAVKNGIAAATLQEQLAELNLERNTQDMKLLVAGNYFDLYRLYNQRSVYAQNIVLAKERLKQIQKLYNQGMVTRNDIIRSELQLSNLNMAVTTLNNSINILNTRLTTAIGLPATTFILPDTTLLSTKPMVNSLAYHQQEALQHYPAIQMAEVNTALAEKSLDITRAERSPALSLYSGNNMARPLTSSGTPVDKYSNGWQVGLSLSFDISSLYKTPKKIKQSALQVEQLKEAEELQRQNTEVAVNAAYIKHNEAIDQQNTLEKNRQLAEENYRIIEKKYLNQMALIIDMLDAANAKLDADLQHTNAQINILYTYYSLLNATGRL
jgi:outer membrane protein TolC